MLVFHYTSPQSAMSILENKSLWFTDAQYLTDKSESSYIRKPFREAYKKLMHERGESVDIEKSVDHYAPAPYGSCGIWDRGSMNVKDDYRYYVLCFSTNSDNASMWNYYVKDDNSYGYCLGFEPDIIGNHFKESRCGSLDSIHGRVIYSPKEQEDILYDKLSVLFHEYDNAIESTSESAKSRAMEECGANLDRDIQDFLNKKSCFLRILHFYMRKNIDLSFAQKVVPMKKQILSIAFESGEADCSRLILNGISKAILTSLHISGFLQR